MDPVSNSALLLFTNISYLYFYYYVSCICFLTRHALQLRNNIIYIHVVFTALLLKNKFM